MKLKVAIAIVAVAPVIALTAAPSWAIMTKSDDTPCSNKYQGVQSKTTYDTYVDPAGAPAVQYYSSSSSFIVRNTYATSKGGGFWFVLADGEIKSGGTYASCYSSMPT